MKFSHHSSNRMASLTWAFGLAVASVTLALVITRGLQPTVFPTPLFFAAIVITTWFGSTTAGLFAVLLATGLLQYYFIAPERHFSFHAAEVLYVGQFSMPALLTCWFVKKRKEAETALKEARDSLDAKVQLRTAELRQSNEQLRLEMAERKRAEAAFHQTQADLAHLTRVTTMSALASSIAHEVNQPLAAIVSNGDACLRWLTADPPNLARAKDSVSRIVGEGSRAGEVVRRIRSLSTKRSPQKEVMQFAEILHDALAILETELTKHKIQLECKLEDVGALVFGDRVQIQQVMMNLLLNAIESMSKVESRPRRLVVKLEAIGKSRLRVCVQDCGSGFDSNDSERIFETFFTTKPEGVGMGLAISRTIIEAHGGRISASMNPDHGATLQFELPIASGSEER
jgi:C4-dicarboxylate-specific signal transduction histidine kinase